MFAGPCRPMGSEGTRVPVPEHKTRGAAQAPRFFSPLLYRATTSPESRLGPQNPPLSPADVLTSGSAARIGGRTPATRHALSVAPGSELTAYLPFVCPRLERERSVTDPRTDPSATSSEHTLWGGAGCDARAPDSTSGAPRDRCAQARTLPRHSTARVARGTGLTFEVNADLHLLPAH